MILDEPSGLAREVLNRLKRTLVDEELEGEKFVDTNGVMPMHVYTTIFMLPEDKLEPEIFYDLTEVIVESKGNSVTLKLRSYNCSRISSCKGQCGRPLHTNTKSKSLIKVTNSLTY